MKSIRVLAMMALATILLVSALDLSLAQGISRTATGDIRVADLPDATPPPGVGSSRAVASTAIITEYVLPVWPLNPLLGANGEVWFSSFSGSAIGKLDVIANEVVTYPLDLPNNVWGLQWDAYDRLWYTVANSNVVGWLNPATATVTEWLIPGSHWGLRVDQASGDIWFTTTDVATGVYRLKPDTNQVTAWPTSSYAGIYDLDMDSTGKIWFTAQPDDLQAVGRLDPVQNQIDVWTLPLGTERPFRILAVTADSIWLTEYDSTGNSVAQLVPSVNLLREYQVPTPGSNLAGLLSHLGQIWFTERAGDKVGVLNPAVSAPISTLLTRSTISTTAVLSTVTVLSRTLTASITPTLVITTAVARVATAGFTEYSLPPNTDWPFANRPFGLTATDDELWFAESGVNRLGVLAMPPHFDVYLPLTRR